ncbi:MAG TPA: polymer-forming cytoskeletal protein [Stellaceae bacterium]|nr:polymer-forming cytoskeletal protein [Stellaceae bacterium]
MQSKQRREKHARVRPSAVPSILGSDLKIEGDIVSLGELHISGSVRGDVVARDLTLGEGGSVTGAVSADIAVIAGDVAGRLTAAAVVLKPTARLAADVTHVSLTMEPGAAFEGLSHRVISVEAAEDSAVRKLLLSPPASSEATPPQPPSSPWGEVG